MTTQAADKKASLESWMQQQSRPMGRWAATAYHQMLLDNPSKLESLLMANNLTSFLGEIEKRAEANLQSLLKKLESSGEQQSAKDTRSLMQYHAMVQAEIAEKILHPLLAEVSAEDEFDED